LRTLTVAEVCKRITSGGTPSREREDYFEAKPGGHLWVKSKELLDAAISQTEEHISDLGLSGSSAKYLDAGTVLVAMYGANVGQLGWLRKPATVNQAICGLTVDPEVADFRWLFYALMQHRHRLVGMAQGAAQQNISAQLIKGFELPVPSLPTQQRIAAILSAYDELIENFGLAREKWRAPTEEPGGVLWETGTDRRRSFGVKQCGWR
jgi:type I restriction enzyme S subunit